MYFYLLNLAILPGEYPSPEMTTFSQSCEISYPGFYSWCPLSFNSLQPVFIWNHAGKPLLELHSPPSFASVLMLIVAYKSAHNFILAHSVCWCCINVWLFLHFNCKQFESYPRVPQVLDPVLITSKGHSRLTLYVHFYYKSNMYSL